MLEPSGGADGEGELEAEVDGGVGGLEGAEPEDELALLDAPVEGEVGTGPWLEVVRRAGLGDPGGVGGGQGLGPLEEGGGLGEGLGEEAELGGYEGRRAACWGGRGIGGGGRGGCGGGGRGGGGLGWGVGVAEGEGEEVDGLGQEGVEVSQGGELDRVDWVDGVGLVRLHP